jgi:hypothetical protein
MGLRARQVPSLSSHIPNEKRLRSCCRAQHHAALVLPQVWVILEISPCGLARGITADGNGAASRLRSGVSTMASSHPAIGTWPLESAAAHGSKNLVLRRREQQPSGCRRAEAQLPQDHNKERTPLRALVSRTRRSFTADVSVFQAHLLCGHYSLFSYRIKT